MTCSNPLKKRIKKPAKRENHLMFWWISLLEIVYSMQVDTTTDGGKTRLFFIHREVKTK